VPTFFVINGYYLWQTLASGHSFARWFKRGLQLYLLWMLIYSPIYASFADLGSVGGVLGILKQFVIGYFHLWYLVGMLGGGLILYLLRKRPTGLLVVLASSAFVVGLVLQYARVYFELPNAFLQHFNQNDYTARNFLFMGFPFMALGFLLARHGVPERATRGKVCLALAIGLALLFGEAWLNYLHQADARQNFDFLASLPVVTAALFLLPFVFFRASTRNLNAKLSSALYYVHPLLLYGALSAGLAYGNTLTAVVVLLACVAAPLLILVSRRVRFLL